MTTYAHPEGNRTIMALANAGIDFGAHDCENRKTVSRYLKERNREKQRESELKPICLLIVKEENRKLQWADECFCDYVERMFRGAHISQLEYFFKRYLSVKNKSLFFMNFVNEDL